jgi:hypothetical protein
MTFSYTNNLLVENKHRLNEIIRLYDMSNVIKEPTRMGALLYPVLISNNNIFIDAEVIEVVGAVSDHDATLIHLKIPRLLYFFCYMLQYLVC